MHNYFVLLTLLVSGIVQANPITETLAAEAVRDRFVGTVLNSRISANAKNVEVSILMSSGNIKKLIVYYDDANKIVMRDKREDIDR